MLYLPLTPTVLPSVLAFVKKKEYLCMGLMEKLLCYKQNLNSEKNYFFILYDNASCIVGVVCLATNGRILHFIPACNSQKMERARLCTQKLLEDFYGNQSSHSLFCIVGTASASLFLAQCAEAAGIAHKSNECDYNLMVYDGSVQAQFKIPKSLAVRKCETKDAFFLADLQKAYYIEEVLPPGMPFNGVANRKLLRQDLKTKLVYALYDEKNDSQKNSEPLAKVSTNAKGINWCQIGGVYTVKKWRNRGYATFLVSYLAKRLQSMKYKSVLFVKKENWAAIRAYQKAQFKQITRFKIIYFNS